MKKGFIGFLLMAFCLPFVMHAQYKAPIAIVYDTIDTCDSYTWIDGHNYTENSTGYYIYKNASSEDSLMVIMTFVIHKSSVAEVSASSCGGYYWAVSDSVYETPGDYTYTLTNAAGCDSVITLHFTHKNPDTTYTDISQCAAYTWSVDGNTYVNDTTVYFTSQTAGADSCHAVYCLRYKQMTTVDTIFVQTCEATYTWPINGVTYNTGKGIVPFRKVNEGGCDTMYTLKYDVGVGQFELPDTTISVFGSFVWGNDTIKTDSTRIDTVLVKTFASIEDCDTVMNYNVTILPVFTIDTAFCGRVSGRRYMGYRWPTEDGDDALIKLTRSGDTTYICKGADRKDSCMMKFHYTDLASDTTWLPEIAACGIFTWEANNTTYRTSQDSILCRLTNVRGCDSIVILTKLTINALPNVYIGGILQVRPGGSTKLFAVGDSNLTYLWSTGETSDTITVSPSENTEYSLTATNSNGCQRSSTATVVVSEGLNQATANSVKVFPNPASTKVTIEGENLVNVKLYNMLGQLMVSKNAVNGKVSLPVADYNNGSYILRAETADGKTTIRSVVIKK
jgi:hypothetical protein